MTLNQDPITGMLRVLADETRLRILVLVTQAELSVGEIARCLAMGQSRISNHLKILREVGLVGERHEGSYTFCRLEIPGGTLGQLWQAISPSLDDLARREADLARLAVVLAERSDSRAFFDRIAGDWDVIGSDFKDGSGRLSSLTCLVPRQTVVADVGCGTGYMAAALARRVDQILCIDPSAAMLEQARVNLAECSAEIEFRQGSMESLPVDDDSVDAAFAHMVLHHLADTRAGLDEMARIVRPGGCLVALELLPHNESWMHEQLADTRLGVDPAALEDDFHAMGLQQVQREIMADRYVVEHPSGRSIDLPLYLVHGRLAG